jgi:DNA-directed RNA polymerase subunit RPC12/RpoP
VIANSDGAKQAGEVTCLSCGCRYFVEERGEDLFFHLDASPAQCQCGAEINIPNQKATIGYRFSCGKCGSEFEIAQQTWGFKKFGADTDAAESSTAEGSS